MQNKLKILKIVTIGLLTLDFIIAIFFPPLRSFIYNFLIPITGFFMILTFVYNFSSANAQKRTTNQELVIKQKFWGRAGLLGISLILLLIYSYFKGMDDLAMVSMILLFILSFLAGPLFGKVIIKK